MTEKDFDEICFRPLPGISLFRLKDEIIIKEYDPFVSVPCRGSVFSDGGT